MKQTIKEQVKQQLLTKGIISNYWCWDNRITNRLSSCIKELRDDGLIIATTRKQESKDTWYYLADNKGQFIKKIPKGYKVVFSN